MRKIFLACSALVISLTGLSQVPDSDGDGIADPDDLCPFVKGTLTGKGCPGVTSASPVFISQESLDNILTAVCTNKLSEQVKARPGNNKSLITSFPFNGEAGSLPVYYKQSGPLNVTVMIGLSENTADTADVLSSVNQLFEKSKACDGLYRDVRLTYNHAVKNYSDVYASAEGGVFFYLEKIKSGVKSLIRLRINRITYDERTKRMNVQPAPAVQPNDCGSLVTVLESCLNGFVTEKGNFIKEEIPAKYYTTTLPGLGFREKYIVDSKNIEFSNGEMIRKNIVYYSTDQEYASNSDALKMFDKMKALINTCLSGNATITDDKSQKIYELVTEYKGRKIRVAVIYLNFFSSTVSVSIKLNG